MIYDTDPNVGFDTLPTLPSRAPQWQAMRIAPSLGMPDWEQTRATVDELQTFWRDIGAN